MAKFWGDSWLRFDNALKKSFTPENSPLAASASQG
jgi:hypothetical protein